MSENIKQIIQELCELDPELKGHEAELEKIIIKLVELRPGTKFNEQFAKDLKTRILSTELEKNQPKLTTLFNFINMKKQYLVMSGALAILVVAVVLTQIMPPQNKPARITYNNQSSNSSQPAKITRLAANSFGALAGSQGNAAVQSESNSKSVQPTAAPTAFGRGGGGGSAVAPTVSSDVAVAPGVDAKMMIYRPYQIKYVYKGEAVELTEKSLDVLRRVKPSSNTADAVSALSQLGFGGINLASFAGSKLTNFELSQPGANGYVVNVNLRDGQVSVSQNYFESTPCPMGVCPAYQPLQESDMPSDEAVISIANSFLADHGVDISVYGSPKIENDWRMPVETMSARVSPGFAYFPDIISVIYQNKINGMEVFEMGGNPGGLRVNVDVRNKKVNGLWSILSQNFEASAYEAETDFARIQKIAEQGGIYGQGYMDPSAEVVEVELGTPKRILTNMWKSDGSGEVIVPALAFPVKNPPKNGYYYVQNNLIVPLIKEMLQIPEPGPIQIMKAEPAVMEVAPAPSR